MTSPPRPHPLPHDSAVDLTHAINPCPLPLPNSRQRSSADRNKPELALATSSRVATRTSIASPRRRIASPCIHRRSLHAKSSSHLHDGAANQALADEPAHFRGRFRRRTAGAGENALAFLRLLRFPDGLLPCKRAARGAPWPRCARSIAASRTPPRAPAPTTGLAEREQEERRRRTIEVELVRILPRLELVLLGHAAGVRPRRTPRTRKEAEGLAPFTRAPRERGRLLGRSVQVQRLRNNHFKQSATQVLSGRGAAACGAAPALGGAGGSAHAANERACAVVAPATLTSVPSGC